MGFRRSSLRQAGMWTTVFISAVLAAWLLRLDSPLEAATEKTAEALDILDAPTPTVTFRQP